ncbi:MAG: hypothetical protein D6767_10270, partial [Candidatus Hydrogenedentota bacterium]
KLLPCAVKQYAIENNIPTLEPKSLKQENESIYRFMQEKPVLFHVVLAYGKIIPLELIESAPKKAVNWHASLLPKLRGAAPIEYALLQDLSETGWSLQQITQKLDAGDVYKTLKVSIHYSDTRDSLAEKLIQCLEKEGANALVEYANGNLKPSPQKEEEATYSHKINPEMSAISWEMPAQEIRNRARALSEKPGIFIRFQQGKYAGKKLKLFLKFSIPPDDWEQAKLPAGSIQKIEKDVLWVCARDACIPLEKLQWEGKKALLIADFLNGYSFQPGDTLI